MEVNEQIKNFKDLVNSYKVTSIIIAAKEIGLFNILTNNKISVEEIAKRLKLERDRIEPILNMLAFYNLIQKEDSTYFLNTYNDVLNLNSEFNQLGYIDFAETIIKRYQKLDNSIKNENVSKNNFDDLTQEGAESFAKGMEANAQPQAKYLINNYKFTNHRILDIGAGAGTYLINVAKNDNTVTGKMIDLPVMSKLQNERIKKNNLGNRLFSESCDYNLSFPTEKYDDVFLFAVVHQEHEKNLKKLIDNIYNILNPNGRLFLTSFFLNENKISPKFAVQFAVEMIASSNDGKVYTFNEIESIIKTKFSDFEKIEDIPGPATLYVAMK
ncbi:MAG: methyltransferase [Clostridium sp.]|nr:methyltransferase [Clostridium sp.]